MQVYLYDLNQNSSYWQTCSNDSTTGWVSVPGSTSGAQYQYAPVPANGYTSCSSSNVLSSMIDTNSGELTMKFYGKAGTATRGIVVSFRRASPLDYLYYTVYEALDSSVNGYSNCAVWYRNGRNSINSNCNIWWFTGDAVNGPLYTQDQLLIEPGNSPTFGRNSKDTIATLATGSVCSAGCQNATFKGTVRDGGQRPGAVEQLGAGHRCRELRKRVLRHDDPHLERQHGDGGELPDLEHVHDDDAQPGAADHLRGQLEWLLAVLATARSTSPTRPTAAPVTCT